MGDEPLELVEKVTAHLLTEIKECKEIVWLRDSGQYGAVSHVPVSGLGQKEPKDVEMVVVVGILLSSCKDDLPW